MTYDVPPPIRPKYREEITHMKAKTDHFFKGASQDSIKAIVSRLRGKYKNRLYMTAREPGGVRVWRTK